MSFFLFSPLGLIALGLLVGGLLMVRSALASRRVPVPGRVVDRSWMTQPPRVTVEYPSPHGETLSARLSAGPIYGLRGLTVGDAVTVYVNPQRPHDVTLGPGSATTTYGVALATMGALLLLFLLRLGS
ncbi:MULTISPECIES: DUF3592 domain-containing protein [unclassified Actinotalea]|uniref:DUF3592 domain-containing protein n=1 Tax=unclassified Actinotalea TaxID=2638618 RepID=UPI0015F4027D|nr:MULTISPECIES: DUF3592 domain-containing protein [unclassified Actinotalea]